jgi:hypothetical protein
MKKNTLIIALGAIVLLTSTTACKKGCTDPAAANFDKNAKKDDKSCSYPDAEITISSPSAGASMMNGDTMLIEATAHRYMPMHGWNLFILNKTSGDTLYKEGLSEDGKDLHISTSWIVSGITAHSDMELNLSVQLSSAGQKQDTSVNFMCMP